MTSASSRWASTSIASAVGAIIVATHVAPPIVQATLLAAVVLVGPGAAIRSWVALPASIALVVTLVAGPALVTIYVALAAVFATVQPEASLLVLAAMMLASGVARLGMNRRAATLAEARS